jgi:hypothetical protein
MDYRIVAADAATGQIQVTYMSLNIDIATYAIDVPIVNGAYITGEALEAEIQNRAPIWLMQRKADTTTARDFDIIQALVQAPTPIAEPEPIVSVAADLNQEAIRAIVYQVLAEINATTV